MRSNCHPVRSLRRLPAFTGCAGAIDTMDLIVGVVLVGLVPFVVLAVAALFSKDSSGPGAYEMGNKPNLTVPEDAEEIEIRFKQAEKSYRSSAKPMFKRVGEVEDPGLREKLRVWATKALQLADSDLTGLKSTIEKPELGSRFSSYISRIQSLQQEIQADLADLKELDVLGRGG